MRESDGSGGRARPDWQGRFPQVVSALTMIDVQPGWNQVVADALEALTDCARDDAHKGIEPVEVVAIQQKYGSMRIDASRDTAAIAAVIETAEAASLRTCEFCGEPGRPRERHDWIVTCCDRCAVKRLGP